MIHILERKRNQVTGSGCLCTKGHFRFRLFNGHSVGLGHLIVSEVPGIKASLTMSTSETCFPCHALPSKHFPYMALKELSFFFKLKLVLCYKKILCEVFSEYHQHLKPQGGGQGILPLLQGDFVGRILNALCGVGYVVGTQLMMGPSVSVTDTEDRNSKWPSEQSPP